MKVIVAHKAEDIPKQPIDGNKPTLVYWNILGLAQSQRLALVAAGLDNNSAVDVRIEAGDFSSPAYGAEWGKAKKDLDASGVLTFPNLPYFMDDKVKITQSGTILQYIARTYANNHDKTAPLVYVSDPTLQTYQDMILDTLSDLEGQIARLSYGQGPDAVKEWYTSSSGSSVVATVLKKFASLDDIYWKKSAAENEVTIAHLKLYVYLYKLTVVQKELGSNDETATTIMSDPWCKAFMSRIENLPKIKEYMASSDYMKGPLNNPSAKWRGGGM